MKRSAFTPRRSANPDPHTRNRCSRREFLTSATAASIGALAWQPTPAWAAPASKNPHLACNQYVWSVFYGREKRVLDDQSIDQALGEMKAAGLDGYEPGVAGPEQIERLGPLLKKHRLEMRSIYVNSTLHEAAQIEKSLGEILAIARAAKAVGTRIIVTNPSPIRWGGPENKDDAQLRLQAEAMNRLGRDLEKLGLQLAYHNHDIELRNAAREFHHMMMGTDASIVHLCLDAHWVYRGAGNSAVALFDVVKLYGKRVCELHLRQSQNGVWTETLGDGDIDYPRLARELDRMNPFKPHLVLEQAIESSSPNTLDVVEAHRRSCEYARRVFAAFA